MLSVCTLLILFYTSDIESNAVKVYDPVESALIIYQIEEFECDCPACQNNAPEDHEEFDLD